MSSTHYGSSAGEMADERSAVEASERKCGHEFSYANVTYACQRAPHEIDGRKPRHRHAAGIDAGLAARLDGSGDDRGEPDLLTWGEDEIGDGQEPEVAWGTVKDYAGSAR
jgi:hypothetical protein